MNILSPGTRIGQYEIASLPMLGGMGVVYFALDHGNDGRPVAPKKFCPKLLYANIEDAVVKSNE